MKKSQSSDYFNKLEKTLAIDDEGNATFAKNLLADGTIGGNSGLKIIHTYEFDINIDEEPNHIIFNVFFEIQGVQGFTCIGSINNTNYGENAYMGLFEYQLDNGELQFLRALYYYDSQEPYIEVYNLASSIPTYQTITYAKEDKTQAKLFNHMLTLTADNKSYTLIYQSTINLNVNSIADLRTITNIKATSDSLILPVCLTDLTATAALQITTILCKVGTANVTAVSDKVTPL